jgi:hypothetical protein
MNMRAHSKLAAVAVLTAVAAGGWAAQGVAAPTATNAKAASTVVDYGGGGGRYQMQVRQSGSSIDVGSFSFTCSRSSSISVTSKVKVAGSGAFSYSGKATMISGAKDKQSKTTLKASGKLKFTKAGSLSSAKSGTVKVSTTASHCSAFSGKLTGYIVPPTS